MPEREARAREPLLDLGDRGAAPPGRRATADGLEHAVAERRRARGPRRPSRAAERTSSSVFRATVTRISRTIMSARCGGSPRSCRSSAARSSPISARTGGTARNGSSRAAKPLRGSRVTSAACARRSGSPTISRTAGLSYACPSGKFRTQPPSVPITSSTLSGRTSALIAADASTARAITVGRRRAARVGPLVGVVARRGRRRVTSVTHTTSSIGAARPPRARARRSARAARRSCPGARSRAGP